MRQLKRVFASVILILVSCIAFSAHGAQKSKVPCQRFADRQAVKQFIWDMHVKHKFNVREYHKLFGSIQSNPKVIQAISKPFEAVSWEKYQKTFVTDERARAGLEFWKANEAALKKAEAHFGVPAEIIVAIIGVETRYGHNRGNFPVLQTLATLAFDYPPRAQFFRKELESFLLLVKEEALHPTKTLGSYAGAMGIPQFIPSSYRRYAVDFTGNGRRDLIHNPTDAIGSVANYFRENGWEPNQPIAFPAQVFGSEYQRLANTNANNPKPRLTLGEYARFNIQPKGIQTLPAIKHLKASFNILNEKKADSEYWLTLQNFYVITRYNHSVNYAMAVYQLSQRILALRH